MEQKTARGTARSLRTDDSTKSTVWWHAQAHLWLETRAPFRLTPHWTRLGWVPTLSKAVDHAKNPLSKRATGPLPPLRVFPQQRAVDGAISHIEQ